MDFVCDALIADLSQRSRFHTGLVKLRFTQRVSLIQIRFDAALLKLNHCVLKICVVEVPDLVVGELFVLQTSQYT
jgi:hypothetical protein